MIDPNDPNIFTGLPSEWREKVTLAARTVAPLFRLYGWEYYDGIPTEQRLRNNLAYCVRSVLDGAMGSSTGRWLATRHRIEGEAQDTITLSLYLAGGEVPRQRRRAGAPKADG